MGIQKELIKNWITWDKVKVVSAVDKKGKSKAKVVQTCKEEVWLCANKEAWEIGCSMS